jgi:nicotinate phosphoribosyltransferase
MTDREQVVASTDAYFEATRRIVVAAGDRRARYGLFMRREVLACLEPAVRYLTQWGGADARIIHRAPEGSVVPSQTALLVYEGALSRLVELETGILQRTGIPCVAAANAAAVVRAMPTAAFIAMHARHCAGDDMVRWCEYAALVGSQAVKREIPDAVGFIGGSTGVGLDFIEDMAPGTPWRRMGTMPHVLIGYVDGDALAATKLFLEHTDIQGVTVLVDFQGREISDSLAVAAAWKKGDLKADRIAGKKLSFRLDTHGGRFLEGLDAERGRKLLADRLRVPEGEVTERALKMLGLGAGERERLESVLFGQGMSAAAVLFFRSALDAAGHQDAGVVASSGFDVFKCRAFSAVGADRAVTGVGTGSFMPAGLAETYATADCFMYDGVFRVKEGREALFRPWID